jgi:hypothetical protein
MGICNAPDIFQSIMMCPLGDLEHVHCYIDDILITSCDSYKDRLEKVRNDYVSYQPSRESGRGCSRSSRGSSSSSSTIRIPNNKTWMPSKPVKVQVHLPVVQVSPIPKPNDQLNGSSPINEGTSLAFEVSAGAMHPLSKISYYDHQRGHQRGF